ncbi:YsnF/AvaK domain-containing protein [Noviherbaspirillum sp.]|uniref:YsnF/AvaK domain-containing protein n=1 Tax=Noviherbaspirillum sp. TaxID=1926288 RepID=UPI002B48ADA8|nr:YsnF/AvaK domain-containing protein [Noviherbaspirillum sp.]HJV81914.1 YsnF/AvaK domain-containing protein [Noviherbaspirillum sp.]
MENTVVGVYDSYAQAQNAMNELLSCGFSRGEVQLNPDSEGAATTRDTTQASGSGIGNFFRSLFGMDERPEEHDVYSEAVRRGSCVLTVNADNEEQRDRAVEVLNRYDPVDIDERAAHWRSQGWTGYDENAPQYTDSDIARERDLHARSRDTADTDQAQARTEGETRIPVVEEEMRVGKREVQRGGVRVYTRVQEKPVHESVDLRQEHVNVERHPVDQPASEADLAAFKEGSVEMREMAEEPIVSKTARVVEEVVVGKEVTQETTDVNDTVRRTDVEVEQLGASDARRDADYADTATSADDSDFRRHWQNAYGPSGGRYEDYDAAYRYGSSMAGSERFRNYRWEDAEPDMRSDWERQHPESTWDKVKDAVRYGAEKVKGQH